jgi:murein DD-endopeptidase MepM/ murein hydrolase activator NlpD
MKSCATPLTADNPVSRPWRRFTHRHAVLACLTVSAALLIGIMLPSTGVEAHRTLPLDLPLANSTLTEDDSSESMATPEVSWQQVSVRSGDSLYEIFKRSGIALTDLPVLLKNNEAKHLKTIHPGDVLHYETDASGALQRLRIDPSPLRSITFNRQGDGFQTALTTHVPEVRLSQRQATIESSLFAAGQTQGLSQSMLLELADIFSGVVDFVLDVRSGDRFGLVYEEEYLDGKRLGNNRILAAYFINQGETHTAYLFTDASGQNEYFNDQGVSMRKAFLRAPLDFTRVSSGFNPRRLHPVFKTLRPHNGIDYAAPRGTPVYAAGDGRVTEAGYSKANGNYVFIQHGPKYVTKYLHLNKRMVKTGQRVTQRQVIGQVGSTGYATGPHLHYEFLVSGVHRNPRTIINELPKAKTLAGTENAQFTETTRGLRLQLATLIQEHSTTQLASNASPSPDTL